MGERGLSTGEERGRVRRGRPGEGDLERETWRGDLEGKGHDVPRGTSNGCTKLGEGKGMEGGGHDGWECENLVCDGSNFWFSGMNLEYWGSNFWLVWVPPLFSYSPLRLPPLPFRTPPPYKPARVPFG